MALTEKEWDVARTSLARQLWIGGRYAEKYGAELIQGVAPRPYRNGDEAHDEAASLLSASRMRQEGEVGRPGLKPAWLSVVEIIEVAAITAAGAKFLVGLGIPVDLAKKAAQEGRKAVGLPSTAESIVDMAANLVAKDPARAWSIVKAVWKKLTA